MADFLDKHILNELLIPDRKDYDNKIDDLFNLLATTREEVFRKAEKKNEAIRAYMDIYNNHISYKKLDQDVHWKELEFLNSAAEETRFIEKYAKIIITFLKDLKGLEVKRCDIVRKAISDYMDKIAEVYGESFCDPESVRKLLENFESVNENNKLFAIDKILSPEELQAVKTKLQNAEAFGFKELFEYLSKVKYEFDHDLPLVINNWEVGLTKNEKKIPHPVTVLMTYDNNLIILQNEGVHPYKLPESRIRFKHVLISRDEENSSVLEFIEKKSNLILFEETNKFRFEFATLEEKKIFSELFEQYSLLH